MTTVEQLLRPEPRRNRWGQYMLPTEPDGKDRPYTRVTTFASSIDDRWNLEQWKQRMVAAGLVARQDLLAQAAAHIGDKQKLNRICDEAVEAAKGSAGANLGTALHTFTEQVDLGLEPTIPSPWDLDIAAYQRTLAEKGIRVSTQFIERIVVHHGFGIAGTFDRLVHVDGWPLPVIADLKTGNLDHASAFGAIAVQLAAYANADELYDPATDQLTPMPPVDRTRALVIHLPAGKATCTLHVVDIVAGWKAAQLCADVRDWRKRKNLAAPFGENRRAMTDAERIEWLTGRVAVMKDKYPAAFEELAASWPAGVPTFRQGGHTTADVEALTLHVSTVEAKHGLPFGDGDPTSRRPDPADVAAIKGRIEQLPAEAAQAVLLVATNAGLPNTGSHKFTVAHLAVLNEIVADAERAVANQSTPTGVQDTKEQAA